MPEQYALLPISDRLIPYCEKVEQVLAKQDIRGYIDDRTESIGRKIRDTELKRIPYMLIVGDNEVEGETVSVRLQGEGDIGAMQVDEFIKHFQDRLDD